MSLFHVRVDVEDDESEQFHEEASDVLCLHVAMVTYIHRVR